MATRLFIPTPKGILLSTVTHDRYRWVVVTPDRPGRDYRSKCVADRYVRVLATSKDKGEAAAQMHRRGLSKVAEVVPAFYSEAPAQDYAAAAGWPTARQGRPAPVPQLPSIFA